MSEFTIRSESVDVEQIMKQIRQRILEKRGADYTEDQIRELASVRLEKFLDPKNLRSDLLEQFRKSRPAVSHASRRRSKPPYTFDDQTLFASHRGAAALHAQAAEAAPEAVVQPEHAATRCCTRRRSSTSTCSSAKRAARSSSIARAPSGTRSTTKCCTTWCSRRRAWASRSQNLRMKVESLSSRLDFSERRVRALEGVVQYRPEVVRAIRTPRDDDDHAPAPQASTGSVEGFVPAGGSRQRQGQGDGSGRRRRRRRRGRRGGQGAKVPKVPQVRRVHRVQQGAQGAQGGRATRRRRVRSRRIGRRRMTATTSRMATR